MHVTLILVTLLSLALAAVMTVLAWRLAREERRRSDARVAALAAEIHPPLPLQQPAPVVTGSDLFTTPADRTASSSRAAAAFVGVAAVAIVAAFVWSGASHLSDASGAGRTAAAASPRPAETPAAAVPLELTALTHERDADRLTVRGIVRNPSTGPAVRAITAGVFLFDRDGGFVTSGRTAIDMLAP